MASSKENYFGKYKGHTKEQSFCQILIFWHDTFHAHAQYIYIVYTKYKITSVKALVQVDVPVYALS